MEIIVYIESCPAFKMSFLINCEISSKFEVNDSDYSRPVSPDKQKYFVITGSHSLFWTAERTQTWVFSENTLLLQTRENWNLTLTCWTVEMDLGRVLKGCLCPTTPQLKPQCLTELCLRYLTFMIQPVNLTMQDCCCLCDHIPLWLPWETGWSPWSGWPWRNPGWDSGEHVGWGPTNMHSIHSTSI